MTTTFKSLATKSDVKASALFALRSGVKVSTVKRQLEEHGISVKGDTKSEIMVHLSNG
jgi:hypothetical protein